jgi:hypothetical protein
MLFMPRLCCGGGRKLQAVEKLEKNVPPCDFVQCAIALT